MKFKYLIVATSIATIFSSCAKKTKTENTADDFLVQYIDSSVKPGDDFFKFATGNWMKNNPIPESEKRWGIANLVRNDIYEKLKGISDEAANEKERKKGSVSQLIGDFWKTAMDSVAVDKTGITALNPYLDKITAAKTKEDILHLAAEFHMMGASPFFSPYIFQDEKNSEVISLHFYQGGLGLPQRDYYFTNDARTENIRNEYKKHIVKMFELLGAETKVADAASGTIFKMETDLARASKKLEELRDPYGNYNKMSVADLGNLTTSIKWPSILAKMRLDKIDSIIIGQPAFFKQLDKTVSQSSMDDLKTYLRWNLINSFASELGSRFDQQNFYFFSTVMNGVKVQRPRWKRMLDQEESLLGDALGKLYADKYVSPVMRDRYTDLTKNMLATYKERIEKLSWMTDSTRQKALEKLSKISYKVCYPDKWRDYSAMNISTVSYLENVINANIWHYNYELNKIGKPVDRTEWDMTPQTYNAYYNPSNNEIVLPAAQFLIPGLPDSLADDAIIYGYSAASTIGHELTHGFDDEGRNFDAYGNLKNWWTSTDSANFFKRANLLSEQFSNFTVLDSLHVNGKASLGENIADLGGVVIGLEAFKKTEQFKKGEKIDGLTPVQRYFLGYTLGWLGHSRDAYLAMQVMTDVHAPNFLRVNGPFSNVPEFYEAFGIKEGDKMWRPDSMRVEIW